MTDYYTITIYLENITQGDVEALAQKIWDANTDDLDAEAGEFNIWLNHNNSSMNWSPKDV